MSRSKLSHWAGLAFGIAGAWGVALPSVAFADQEAGFEAMDTNGDGKISPDEHAMATGQMFEKMDANGDNRVTAAEMTAAHQKITGKKPEKGEMTAVEKSKVGLMVRESAVANSRHGTMFLGAGKGASFQYRVNNGGTSAGDNGDSVLTVEEYAAGSQWMFGQMDTDHDGYLTKDEVKAGHQKFMHKKAQHSSGSTRPAD